MDTRDNKERNVLCEGGALLLELHMFASKIRMTGVLWTATQPSLLQATLNHESRKRKQAVERSETEVNGSEEEGLKGSSAGQ